MIQEDRVRTNLEAFTAKFGNVPLTRIVIEVGAHSPWVSRLLQTQGHEVIVANPRRVRLIYESKQQDRPTGRTVYEALYERCLKGQ